MDENNKNISNSSDDPSKTPGSSDDLPPEVENDETSESENGSTKRSMTYGEWKRKLTQAFAERGMSHLLNSTEESEQDSTPPQEPTTTTTYKTYLRPGSRGRRSRSKGSEKDQS